MRQARMHVQRQGRLDAHRRLRQGGMLGANDRRRRPAAHLRRRPVGQDHRQGPRRHLVHRRRRLQPGHVPRAASASGVWHLPVVCNGYAEATSSNFHQQGIDVADGFGMPGVVVDGHDFFAVHEAAGEAIARARSAAGRRSSSARSTATSATPSNYRGPNEVENLRRCDRLDGFVSVTMRASSSPTPSRRSTPRSPRSSTKRWPRPRWRPSQKDLLTDVYVSY